MKIIDTPIQGLKVLEPRIFNDDRGYFFESYNRNLFPKDRKYDWVQDNESKSTKGVLRGLHYQAGEHGQAKLVRSVVGSIYDVAVDIRPDSDTYGEWYGIELNDQNKRQLLIPRGFAHGFLVLSNEAIFSYKCDSFYNAKSEGGIIYNDVSLGIKWPYDGNIQLSAKDKTLPDFGDHKPSK